LIKTKSEQKQKMATRSGCESLLNEVVNISIKPKQFAALDFIVKGFDSNLYSFNWLWLKVYQIFPSVCRKLEKHSFMENPHCCCVAVAAEFD